MWNLKRNNTNELTYKMEGGSDGKESVCNAGDPGLTPGSGRSPGEANGSQYYLLFDPVFGMAYLH